MADTDFYSRDRPAHPRLPEDRPRGGGPKVYEHHKMRRGTMFLIAFVILVLVGILLFP
ncbi:hypothetical protein [Streptomyces sp. NPDC056244]|uniref:hypothetical protein n=1 Tax=unclassified Streptomyces TaxID=2593676 RepID=UPI0035DA6F56